MALKVIPGGGKRGGNDDRTEEPAWADTYSDDFDIATAREHWTIVTGAMAAASTYSPANAAAVRRLVDFQIQYARAAREVAEHGAIICAARTGTPQISPFWTAMRQASEAIMSAESELGLSPVRRDKAVKVARKPTVSRPADAYLRPVDDE